MTSIDYRTGEVIEFDKAAAERRAERITLRLDAIADNYRAVLPMIREAIEKRDDLALGYRSPGDYVSDRFGQSLSGLGIEVRRAVVGELTEAGLSTRAIAPVVGVSDRTVANDQKAGAKDFAPASEPSGFHSPGERIDAGEPMSTTDETPEGGVAPSTPETVEVQSPDVGVGNTPAPRPPVTGIDGKTYQRPESPKPRRRPITDQSRDAGWELRKSVERIERIAADDRFTANKNEVAAQLRGHLQNAVEVCQDLLARIDN